MKDITITMTGDEVQYLINSIDTHVKTHGLGVATTGVVILSKLQAASNISSNSVPPTEEPNTEQEPEKS